MKPRIWAAIAAGIALTFWGSWEYLRAVRAEGAAAVYEQRADSLYAVAIDQEEALHAMNTQENSLIDRLAADRDSALARAARAEHYRPHVVDRIVEHAGADSTAVRTAVEEALDSVVVEEIAPLRIALATADSIAAARTRQRDAALAVNASLRSALEASRTEAAGWKATRPGFLDRQLPKVALIGGLALGWAIRGAL